MFLTYTKRVLYDKNLSRPVPLYMDIQQRRLVGGAIGGLAYYNGWNGIQWNGVKHVVSVCLVQFQYCILDIIMSPSSYSSYHQPPLVWLRIQTVAQ